MSSSRNDRGRAGPVKTRASKESGELRQKRRLVAPTADLPWQDSPGQSTESKKRSNPAATRRNASAQRATRNEQAGIRKTAARKGSVDNETQRRPRKASPKDEFTHGRDNIEQLRKTFFKGSGPDRTRKSTTNLPKEKPVITTAIAEDEPIEMIGAEKPKIVGGGQRKSMLPARKKDVKPLSRPEAEQMHGRVIQEVVYDTDKKKDAPKTNADEPAASEKAPAKRPAVRAEPAASEKAKDVPQSIRQSKTKAEELPRVGPVVKVKTDDVAGQNKTKTNPPAAPVKETKVGEEEAPRVLTSKDRAALRVAQLAKLKQVDPDLGDARQRQSLIERIRGILAAQQDEEDEEESVHGDEEEEEVPMPRSGPPKPESMPPRLAPPAAVMQPTKAPLPKKEATAPAKVEPASPKQEASAKAAKPKAETNSPKLDAPVQPKAAAPVKAETSPPKPDAPVKAAQPKTDVSAPKSAQPKATSPVKAEASPPKQQLAMSPPAKEGLDPSPAKTERPPARSEAPPSKPLAPSPGARQPSKSSPPKWQRPHVSFDLSGAPSDGKPMQRYFDMPDFLNEFDDDGEPPEEKPFTEPTDFLKAYRFPKDYMVVSIAEEEEEEDADLMPRTTAPVPEPLPSPHSPEVSTDDSVVSLSLVRPETPEKKPRHAEFSPIKSSIDKFSESVSLDEFVKLETEMLDEEEDEEDEFDHCCPNFAKLSQFVRQELGGAAAAVVAEMKSHKDEHFVFLVSGDDHDIDAIYLLRANLQEMVKIWGDGPNTVTHADVSAYWYFNAVTKQFESAKKPGFRHNLDAVSL